jgi:hypothetical protein
VAIALCLFSVPISAAEETPVATPEETTPESQQLKQVQADAAIAKAKLELAQSELDLLKLKLGTLDTTNLPKGTATVADMNLEANLRAYAAASRSIDLIAANVATVLGKEKSVVLATDTQLQALNQYRSFLAQLDQLQKRAQEVLSATPPELKDPCAKDSPAAAMAAGISTAIVAINSMLSFAALFKKDIDLKGKDITLNEFALMTLMLQSLKDKGITPIYPAAYYLLPPGSAEETALEKKWDELFAYKQQLSERAQAYAADFDDLPAPANPDAECKKKIAALKARVDAYLAGLAAAGKAIDDVGATLTKQDAQSGLTLLSTYLVSERVEKAIGAAPVLQLKAIAAGGSTQIVKSAFSSKVSFGGGSIISYQLFAQDGTLELADTVAWNAGFAEMKDLEPGRVELKQAAAPK